MKLLMSEYTSGFSDYSYILCNYFAGNHELDQIIYLTPADNQYFNVIDRKVDKRKVFKIYSTGKAHKKGSLLWIVNRVWISVCNCIKRNCIIRKEHPNAILIQASHSVFDWFFLKITDKSIVRFLTIHDVIVPTKSFSWSMKSLKRMYMTADCLIVHSNTNKSQLMNLFSVPESKIAVIPHGIKGTFKKKDRQDCRSQLKIGSEEKVLLFYGGIRKSKGLDVLLKSLKGLKCHLLIAGALPYGENFEPYQKLIDKYHIDATVIIKFTSDEFRDILFQASDYLVLPYKEFYSQSGVFMQAIQYHLPVIATDVSSFREYIEKYRIGYIAKPNDVSSLHDAIKAAVTGDAEFEEGMRMAIAENCWEVTSTMYSELILGSIYK